LEEGGIRQAPIVGAELNELNDGDIGCWCHETEGEKGEQEIRKRRKSSLKISGVGFVLMGAAISFH
jgi:hypothetical protein